MKAKVFTVNAFSKNENGGNPAGILLTADFLLDENMQEIASKVNLSETVFILESAIADFKIKFFTPNKEVDLCGHGTIAAFYTMAELGILKPGKYRQETKAGILDVEINKDNSVMMDQPIPVFSEIINKNEIADSLNIHPSQICKELPVQIVSTGLRDLLVPIINSKVLNSISPNMEKITEISKKYNAVGYHIFAIENDKKITASCRNFAPLYGIPEESATGTSSGALACYLLKYGIISDEKSKEISFEQGKAMNRTSQIRVSLILQGDIIEKVKVGGLAKIACSQTYKKLCVAKDTEFILKMKYTEEN